MKPLTPSQIVILGVMLRFEHEYETEQNRWKRNGRMPWYAQENASEAASLRGLKKRGLVELKGTVLCAAGLSYGNTWEDDRECLAYGFTDAGREIARRLPQRDDRVAS